MLKTKTLKQNFKKVKITLQILTSHTKIQKNQRFERSFKKSFGKKKKNKPNKNKKRESIAG